MAVLAALVTTACSGANIEPAETNPTPGDIGKGPGLLSGESGNLLDAFRAKDENGRVVEGGIGSVLVPVNPYLWRASLEAVAFMSLAQTDSTGGTIITEWYVNPNNTNERVKVNILILGRQFQVQNLKVNVFKQVKTEGSWVDATAEASVASQLEDTILTNARAIKVREQAQ